MVMACRILLQFSLSLNVTVSLFTSSNNTLNQVWAEKTAKQQVYRQNFETLALSVIKICNFSLSFFFLHDHMICKT